MSDQLPDHCSACGGLLGDDATGGLSCRGCAARAEVVRLRAEIEALKAEALEVCGIVYGQLTAGVVDDHDRIMRACNELAEFGRRLTGEAPPLKHAVAPDEQEATG